MIFSNACPRCNGAIVDYEAPLLDGPLCLNCGWRQSRPAASLPELAPQSAPRSALGAESLRVSAHPEQLTVRRAAV